MKFSKLISAFLLVALLPGWAFAQNPAWPAPPEFKSYKDKPGRVTKYNTFNYLDILGDSGEKLRQAMGQYWEVAYAYDSVFRQKRKFKEFMMNQILEQKGEVFFQDTLQFHFVVPAEKGNVWGRVVLASDKIYRLRLIKEEPFNNRLVLDVPPTVPFDAYVEQTQLPPRINYIPGSVITRIQHSKFNHQEISWNVKDTLFKQKLMGPFWDVKLEVRDLDGKVDKSFSTVELMESYYRACLKIGGTVVKSRPRELIFTLPVEKAMLWCRISASLDGVYFVRATLVDDKDKVEPVKLRSVNVNVTDSLEIKGGAGNQSGNGF